MTTITPSLPLYIDSTMLVHFRQCPRKFYWEYILGLRPSGLSIDLVAGGAFAAGLEAAYAATYMDNLPRWEALKAAYRAFMEAWGDFPDPPNEAGSSAKTCSRMFGALISYFDTYGLENDPIQPMLRHDGAPTFEFSFALPLTDPRFPRHPSGDAFIYAGRFDAFGHFEGRMVIRDEKTSGKGPTKNWSKQWDLRNQFILYCWAAQQFGYPVDTVVIRGVTIQKTQYQHVEAIKTYPQFVIDRAVDQLARDLHRLVDSYTGDHFDYNFGDACTAFGGVCSYLDLCGDSSPERWFSDFERVRWSPLTRTLAPLTDTPEELDMGRAA